MECVIYYIMFRVIVKRLITLINQSIFPVR